MDPSKPAIELFYGKYLDRITNPVPPAHIDPEKNPAFGKSIEPGKPNFPTADSVSVVLENLDPQGNERYPKQWFLDNARSEAEGAVNPFELFFQVHVYGELAFTGMYASKTYSVNRDTVTVEMVDVAGIFDRDKAYFLKPFTFDQVYVLDIMDSGHADNPVGTGTDLEGNSIDQQAIKFSVVRSERVRANKQIDFTDDYTLHAGLRGIDQPDIPTPPPGDGGDTSIFSRTRSAYVQIGDITLLTRITEEVVYWIFTNTNSITYHFLDLYITVWHANNGNYSEQGVTVLERGRYFADDSGADLQDGQRYRMTIWDYNLGEDADILPWEHHFPFGSDPFLHGAQVNKHTGNYTIVQDSASWKDLLQQAVAVTDNHYRSYYDSAGTFFDLSKATSRHRKAFIADALLCGWMKKEGSISRLLVDVARQTNCYLYSTESGRLAFHSRDWHTQWTAAKQLPPGSVDLGSGPFRYHAGEGEDGGFQTFTITIPADRVEINNVESDEEVSISVDASGVRQGPSVRNTDLEIANYRLSDLGVPQQGLKDERHVFRYSPADPDFPGYSSGLIDEFIPTATGQAIRFAGTLDWPTEFIYPELPGQHFPGVSLGGYVHRREAGTMKVYLVLEITRTTSLWKRCTLQKVAEWEV